MLICVLAVKKTSEKNVNLVAYRTDLSKTLEFFKLLHEMMLQIKTFFTDSQL